jgi:hypothetical protein
MKPSVSSGNKQATVLGAGLGIACAIFDASPAVVYGVAFSAVGLLVWINLGPAEGHPLRFLRRRP